jgi:hypothetical protein
MRSNTAKVYSRLQATCFLIVELAYLNNEVDMREER